jgi:fibronectin type III domain protein/cysteine-rich secretory family protein
MGPSRAQVSAATTPDWLSRFNDWRASSGLSALSENATWSQGDYNHSRYMVKNNEVAHSEVTTHPYYTAAGDTAARDGNIEVNTFTSFSDRQAIDWWMAAPFHAIGMMDPRLTATGFGAYREVKSGWQVGFTVDVLRGNPFTGGKYPVYFPGNGATVPLTSYHGQESPNPLQACPGYTAPSGLPAFIEVGGNVTTSVTAHSFTGDGVALAHCVIDSNTPSIGSGLRYRGGVIVMPRAPLVPGVRYTVNLTVNGKAYTWSFGVTTSGTFAPGAPANVVATAGDASATVRWDPPTNVGVTPISGYVVTAYNGTTVAATQAVGPLVTTATLYGLTNGTAYTLGVVATNRAGPGPSTSSSAVTPSVPAIHSTRFVWFGTRALASPSGALTATLTNSSAATVTVGTVAVTGANAGDFTKGTDGCSAHVLAPSATCNVQVTFTASGNGTRNAAMTFPNDGPNAPATALTGVGGTSQAATKLYFPFYDFASAGVRAETIHITNPSGAVATGSVAMPGQSTLSFLVGPGMDRYYTFPKGAFGGPVVISSTNGPVIASLRATYYQSFNETPAQPDTAASSTLYFPWYDLKSAGMSAETIHITNVSSSASTGTIALPGAISIPFTISAGTNSYFMFPKGTFGGPVKIAASQPVIASLRSTYYQSFNERLARSSAAAATHLYFPWYDFASAGMRTGTIHITNPGATAASGSIQLAGASTIAFSVAAGLDAYYTFPQGTRGGPVAITSSQPVLTSLRIWYYNSFNEISGRPASPAASTQYFPWYDLASSGMRADAIHLTNPGTTTVTGTIAVAGWGSVPFSVAAGQDGSYSLPAGAFGGPVTVNASAPIVTALRALYYSSLNELPGSF